MDSFLFSWSNVRRFIPGWWSQQLTVKNRITICKARKIPLICSFRWYILLFRSHLGISHYFDKMLERSINEDLIFAARFTFQRWDYTTLGLVISSKSEIWIPNSPVTLMVDGNLVSLGSLSGLTWWNLMWFSYGIQRIESHFGLVV